MKYCLAIVSLCFWSTTIAQTIESSDPYNPVQVKYKLSLAISNARTEPDASLLVINNALKEAERAKDRMMIFEALSAKAIFYMTNELLDEALIVANQAYLLATELKSETLILQSYQLLSRVHVEKDIKEEVLEYLYKGLSLSKELNDTVNISFFFATIPVVELELANIGSAMQYALLAKDFFQTNGDSIRYAESLITLGIIHANLGNFPAARENMDGALSIINKKGDAMLLGKVYLSLTSIYIDEGRLNEAEQSCQRAVGYFQSISQKEYQNANSLLAEVLIGKGDYHEATKLLASVIDYQQSKNDFKGLPQTFLRLGNLYLIKKNAPSAIDAFSRCIAFAQISGSVNLIRQAYKGLSQAYSINGNYSKAFTSLQNYVLLTDSLYNMKKVSEAVKMEEQLEKEKHNEEMMAKELELERRKEQIQQQKQKQLLLYLVLILFAGVIVFAYREFSHKKLANTILGQQKEELERQKKIAERQTRDFTDSLNYAKRIQQAILRASLKLKEYFPESFLMLIPRELVSGDFYWFKERKGKLLFAIADCTGHGVPGAFMSIIGTYGLNRIVNEQDILSPGEVLNHMNQLFTESLEQRKGVEIFDGMDIAFCNYNPGTMELIYAGANIPLYICRNVDQIPASSHIAAKNQSHVLYQIRPNKQAVGSYFEKVNFINHSIKLIKDDIIYICSDGYGDQFGGPDGKKFRSTELRKLLCNLADTPLDRQRGILEHTFIEWKGKKNQVDDVSFMGIKV